MDDRFSDILIDNAPENNRNKKIILLVIAAVILAGILAVYVLTSSNEQKTPSAEQQLAKDSNLQEQQEEPAFAPVATQPNTKEEDRFEQIVRNIQERDRQKIEPTPAPQEPTPPILEQAQNVDTQPKEPILAPATPPKEPTQAPTQVAQAQPPKPTQNTQAQAPKPAQSTPKPTPQSQPKPKPSTPTQSAQNTQAPKNTMDKSRNGQVAQRGHYIQVGNFENTPNKDFLGKLDGYSYRIQPESGSTKYLIGPFSSRTDANRELLKIRTDVGGEAFYYEVK